MASDEEYGRPSRKNWFDQMDELEWDDDEAERLPCSVDYVTSCLLLPCLNGCINGFAGSVQAIYFKDMGWPLWRLGLALALGFSSRLLTQRVQVRFGIWTAVPMSTLHLVGAVLAVVFTTEEWAIFTEIVCLCAFDSSMAIEGIAFDCFSDYPESSDFARQATSTSLGVFTVFIAIACTVGAVLYDAFSWRGISIFHCACQGTLLLLLLVSPSCRWSFKVYFLGYSEDYEYEDDDDDIKMTDLQVQPNQPSTLARSASEIVSEAAELEQQLPGCTDLAVQSMEDHGDHGRDIDDLDRNPSSKASKVSFSQDVAAERPSKVSFAGQEAESQDRASKVSFADGSGEARAHKSCQSRVTFGEGIAEAEEGVTVVQAPMIPTQATADGDEVDGVDYDKVDETPGPRISVDLLEDDAGTPNSTQNLYKKKRKSGQGSIISHRSNDESGAKRSVRVRSDSDETEEGHAHAMASGGRDGRDRSHRQSRTSRRPSHRQSHRQSRVSQVSHATKTTMKSRLSRVSCVSRVSGVSHISRASEAALRTTRISQRNAQRRTSEWQQNGRRSSRVSTVSRHSTASAKSTRSVRSQMTSLAAAGTNFEHHFMVNSTLGPQMVTPGGKDPNEQDDFGEEEPPLEDVPWEYKGNLPKASGVPMFLIWLCCLVNSFSYATEFGTFGIFFREYYQLSDATYAAVGQTVGDFLAAMVMQLNTFSDQFPCCGRCLGAWEMLAFPPYNLSWALLTWVALSGFMLSGFLPLAIAGQVLMSSLYCLSSKFATDLIYFYSRGDVKLFMKLQLYFRSTEAVTLALANFLGLLLLELVDPRAPYLVVLGLAVLVFLLYTNGFCARLSCENIVVAEERRLNMAYRA